MTRQLVARNFAGAGFQVALPAGESPRPEGYNGAGFA